MHKTAREKHDALARWLPQCRWFGYKRTSDRDHRLRCIDSIVLPGHELRNEPVQLEMLGFHTDTAEITCVAPVQYTRDQDGTLLCHDATQDECFHAWLLEQVLERKVLQTSCGSLRGHLIHTGLLHDYDIQRLAVSPLGANASNTSAHIRAFDSDTVSTNYVAKWFRTFSTGTHPESEIGTYLAQKKWPNTPTLVGWLEYTPQREGQGGTVATLHEFIPRSTSLWDYSLDQLSNHENGFDHLLATVAEVGKRTAGMHKALTDTDSSSAFAPVVPLLSDRETTANAMVDHAQNVWNAVRVAELSPSVRHRIDQVLSHHVLINDALRKAVTSPQTAAYIRVHGDYHLGQILITPENRRIEVIDFEGEPQKALTERRRRTSVCKDLAGMSRSFDYLCFQERFQAHRTGTAQYSATELVRTFLEAYEIESVGACFYSDNEKDRMALFNAFMLDKAIYELGYEIHYRPDWIDVPLRALETYLDTGSLLHT